MEKLEEKVGRFLSSLTQYLQQLCHESVDFDKFAVVTGHLFLTLDNDKDIEFNVNETVYKTENNVIEYMSNSHHLPPLQVQHDLLLPVKEEKSVSSLEFTSLNKPGKGQPKKKGKKCPFMKKIYPIKKHIYCFISQMFLQETTQFD